MLVGHRRRSGPAGHLPHQRAARRPAHRAPADRWPSLLLLVGGASASRRWCRSTSGCPSAMAAPTPVSAYLHAAAMVKAGVYLVALLAPGVRRRARLARRCCWRSASRRCCSAAGGRCGRTTSSCCSPTAPSASSASSCVVLGVGTRSCGAGRARHADRPRAVQGDAVPGRRRRSTTQAGTRDLRELSGRRPAGCRCSPSRRRSPAASMAGLPPLLGFVAKESVLRRAARRRPRR